MLSAERRFAEPHADVPPRGSANRR